MLKFKKTHAVLAMALLAAAGQAATIRVPQDRRTIQSAIDDAKAGDVVLVAPGTYCELLDFSGKSITVTSSDGPKKTIIDGGRAYYPVVNFHSGETREAVLSGFTLQNGNNKFAFPALGGGVRIYYASPTIRDNIVRDNSACAGNGISAHFSSALIVGNLITHNKPGDCGSSLTGGGVEIGGDGVVEFTDNVVEYNESGTHGGGVGLWLTTNGRPLIARNIIRFNLAEMTGGGVATSYEGDPTVVNNAIYANTAYQGGGVALQVPADGPGGQWVNNTIADNEAEVGSEFYSGGDASLLQLINNIFVTSKGSSSLFCSGDFKPVSPVFRRNDIYARQGATIGGVCAAAAGQNGNIAADPLFDTAAKGAKAYAPKAGSPAMDAGVVTSVPGGTDAFGHKRRVDGDGDGRKVIDLGAIEYRPR